MAEVEVLFHDIWSITNLLNFLTTNHPMNNTHCHLQHALSSTRRNTFNRNETAGLCSRAAQSILGDSQCGCAAA